MEPGNNYRNNPRGTNSDHDDRRAQAELMWDDRLARGMSNRDIAKKYKVSERTVTNRFTEFPKENVHQLERAGRSSTNGDLGVKMSQAAMMWEQKNTEGLSNKQLAERHGVSQETVARRLNEYFPDRAAVALEKVRQREVDKLDMLEERSMQLLNDTAYVVDKGVVVLNPFTGQPLEDLDLKFKAIDRLLKIQERRSKLLGADAPVRAEVTHNTGVEIQVNEIRDLVDDAKQKLYAQEEQLRTQLEASRSDVIDAEVVEDEGES